MYKKHFSEHSLAELNEEVYRTGIVDWSGLLPRTLGGGSVGLLMGITSTKTDPVLEYTLPNGLGLYRSPFRDRDGFSLAYGGHHQIFSRHYTKVTGNDSYNKFLGELHRVRGEIWDKALGPDHYDPTQDCGLALQLPVEHARHHPEKQSISVCLEL